LRKPGTRDSFEFWFKKPKPEVLSYSKFSKRWNWRVIWFTNFQETGIDSYLKIRWPPNTCSTSSWDLWKKIGTSNLVLGSILQKVKNSSINFEKLRPSSNSDLVTHGKTNDYLSVNLQLAPGSSPLLLRKLPGSGSFLLLK
jgi:hypothetical protein